MEISLYRIMLFGLQIEKLKKFYVDNFDFSVIEEIKDEWVVLKAGQFEIALHKIRQEFIKVGEHEFWAESNAKLIFRINSDLSIFRQKLIENGVEVQEIKSFKGFNSLFCDGIDVEGNVFQIEQRLD